jgi:hypothetical protein
MPAYAYLNEAVTIIITKAIVQMREVEEEKEGFDDIDVKF